MTVENLDTNQTLTNENGKATPYLEDFLFQIVEALGGEGSTDVITTIEDALESGTAGRLRSSIESVKNRVNDLEITTESPTDSRLLSLRNRIDDLEKTLPDSTPGNRLFSMKKDLEAIEVQINTPINLKSILDRLNAIEAQL